MSIETWKEEHKRLADGLDLDNLKTRFKALADKYPEGVWSVEENARETLKEYFGTRWPETTQQEKFFLLHCLDEDSMRESHEDSRN